MPFDFVINQQLRALQLACREPAPFVIGRVMALAIACYQLKRSKFRLDDLDAVVAWGQAVPFGDLLVRVEWAELVEDAPGVYLIKLPDYLMPYRVNAVGGIARAKGAKRDEQGKYLKKKSAPDC